MDTTIQELINARHARQFENWRSVPRQTSASSSCSWAATAALEGKPVHVASEPNLPDSVPLPPNIMTRFVEAQKQFERQPQLPSSLPLGIIREEQEDDNDDEEDIVLQRQQPPPPPSKQQLQQVQREKALTQNKNRLDESKGAEDDEIMHKNVYIQEGIEKSVGYRSQTVASVARTTATVATISQNGISAERPVLLSGGGYTSKNLAHIIDKHHQTHGPGGDSLVSVAGNGPLSSASSVVSGGDTNVDEKSAVSQPSIIRQVQVEDLRDRASAFTFRPKLNKKSEKIVERKVKKEASISSPPSKGLVAVPVEKRLLGFGKEAQKRLERLRKEQEEERRRSDMEGNFRPVTNHSRPEKGDGKSKGLGVYSSNIQSNISRKESPPRKWSDRASAHNSVDGFSRYASETVHEEPPNRSAIRFNDENLSAPELGGDSDVVTRLYEWDRAREERLAKEQKVRMHELAVAALAHPYQPKLASSTEAQRQGLSDSMAAAQFYDAVLRPQKVSGNTTVWHRNRNEALAISKQSQLKAQENISAGWLDEASLL